MKTNLSSYTIMPLDLTHLEEICQDIREQNEKGIASCALFSMTLVPEGNPPADKVTILCEKYAKFKARLSEMGLKSGILVQATVGHGWILGGMFPYQTHVNFTDGAATRVVCPCDEGFKDYIYNVMATIARYEPDHVMIDDDLRTIWFKGEGCACPLHMDMFNKRAGTSLTDRELWKIVNERTEISKKYTDIFIDCQRDSLVQAAKTIRAGLDSVNQRLPASYCCCGNNAEFAYEISSVLAGEGNPVTVRINNGNYTPQGARYLSRVFHRAATQIAKLKGKVDVLLAETDTCPQNRYSVSAQGMHSHYTGSILEGVNGAKHWITRLITHEPKSGEKYREILAKNRGFYEKLAELQPSLKWRGCRIFVPSTPDFTYGRVKEEWDGWSYCVLEKLGLPMYYSSENGGVVCLEGDVDSRLSNDEIMEILKGSVMLASDTAKNLIKRGFGKYLGVDVREWTGKQPIREIYKNGSKSSIQMGIKELVPTSEKTVIDSLVCNTTDYEKYEELFPGVTAFENELGGKVFVFSGTPVAEFHLSTAFSYLNYSRKEQLIRLLSQTGEMPLYYPNDEEVYLKVADMENGQVFCALFNIGLDPIDKVQLVCSFNAKRFEALLPNGETKEIPFACEKDKYILDISAKILDPVVIFITK
ncbi:MAG: hypothetical protein E7596_04405 [Ruminococcaceae bacterium]|nr:hypothetical protein [Oscillospiraceae bacterium]